MNVNIHWGNVVTLPDREHVQYVIEKNLSKIFRFFKRIDENTIHLEVRFNYDTTHKKYTVKMNLLTPKEHHFIQENGFTWEETITNTTNELRRKIRKSKEKKITTKRKKIE